MHLIDWGIGNSQKLINKQEWMHGRISAIGFAI